MSLDGYIADANGGHDWIIMDPTFDFGAFMAAFDTVLVGRRTFEATKGMGGGGMPGMRAIVCSSTLSDADAEGQEVVRDAVEALKALKREPGKDIWLFGGGSLFRSLLEAGVVDLVEVSVIPVILGSGVPLVAAGGKPVRLSLLESRPLPNGTIVSTYSPA